MLYKSKLERVSRREKMAREEGKGEMSGVGAKLRVSKCDQ